MVRNEVDGGVAVLTLSNPPVNALGADLRAALDRALAEAIADATVRAIVIAAEGKVFVAGADISEFGKVRRRPLLPEVLARIDASPKPVVAAIGGAALGGGLELALACHARIAGRHAKLGLPEIKIGIIPGAGGTQRLPRLIGPETAFAMMLSGEPVGADRGAELGIVDAVVLGDLVPAARVRALELADAGRLPRAGDRDDRLDPEARAAFEARAADAVTREPDAPNVRALAEAVRACFDRPFAEGLAAEQAAFAPLVDDPRARALRHAFFAEREAARVPGLSKDTPRRPIETAAVIGAGTMGGGIAMCFANAGIPVTVIETEEAPLQRGLERVRGLYAGSAKRGSITEAERDARIGRITGAVGLENAGSADIVIEAAFEEMGVKRAIFSELDRIAKHGAILATNTSYLDVDAIAAVTGRPQDVLGMHFFSPANVMRLVEVVRAEKTAPEVLATALDLGKRLKKLPVAVGVCFGFVGNRILERRSRAAERLLLEGALPHEVDAAVTAFGFRMGPFAMSDLAGLDIGWRSRKDFGGRAPVADALAEMGRFGQKTGRGFFVYPDGARAGQRDPEVEALIARTAAEHGIAQRSFTPEEIVARLMYPMVNEGARILSEKIASRPGDIDTIWINGYNWPAWRGGPMHWADTVGLKTVAADLERFARETGDDSQEPAPLLKKLAEEGGSFGALKAA
ncbi:3-hydroxyacyl-CoA dehydrogenase NAD-binding domain-containing protein [Methylobacterium sp. NEAU 140]|uniref:3-hydroxyacyl-CoA dehydrogenase NAD-binding domain-containing protein n=1 Tax=Methylobacterium sp. NEAU 140 TaxID=3064945 RepID=UPI0027324FC7|nr:3-hydroxyacyl-CoA dehydrogenase NAD-binding domain-containing protein [Methylobacterium sp. NEAU 140]MDP4024724.1 3-hydroxyacyl-CoA dehydrogenase NAD-binding domain-containing protein [Methylobacterium sp. NEAU 140]